MKSPLRAGVAVFFSWVLVTSALAADFHAVCPYDPKLCASYDELEAGLGQAAANGTPSTQFQRALLDLSQQTESLVVEQSESWPLKDDRASLGGIFNALGGLRDKLQALAPSQGDASASTAQILAQEKSIDRLFAALPSKSDPPSAHDAFAGRVAALQGEVGATVRTDRASGSPNAARLAALRDALAMLVAANGISVSKAATANHQEALLQTKQGAMNGASVPSPTPAPAVTPNPPVDPKLAARIRALPYEQRIKGYLTIIATYADPVDAENTISTLEKVKPGITIAGFKLENGEAGSYDPPVNQVVIQPGFLTKITNPSKSGIKEPVQVLENRQGMRASHYADGHVKYEYYDDDMATHLIHEIQHARRHGDGGGANNYTNELDAFDVQERFTTLLVKAKGWGAQISEQARDRMETWQRSPESFVRRINDLYQQNHEFDMKELTIDQQTEATASRLRSLEASADALRQGPKAKESSQAINDLRQRLKALKKDRELDNQAKNFNRSWRIRMRFERATRGQ